MFNLSPPALDSIDRKKVLKDNLLGNVHILQEKKHFPLKPWSRSKLANVLKLVNIIITQLNLKSLWYF